MAWGQINIYNYQEKKTTTVNEHERERERRNSVVYWIDWSDF